jgi:transcription elongation factor/antiterminator RfaH
MSLISLHRGPAASRSQPWSARPGVGLQSACLEPGERWYAVHTAPHKERFAQQNLARQGFRSFLPTILRSVRHARRTQTTRTAFFPRYLFVVLDPERDRWRSVNGTFGVSTLVTVSGRPAAVPAGVVEGLLEAADEGGGLDLAERLRVGQKVRVLRGPFAESVAMLVRLDGRRRVELLLEFMGAVRRVSTTSDLLMPMS